MVDQTGNGVTQGAATLIHGELPAAVTTGVRLTRTGNVVPSLRSPA
jgi:hypothetical protein